MESHLERIARAVWAFASAGRRVTRIGAFNAFIDEHSDIPWLSGAYPALPATEDGDLVADSLAQLRAHFQSAGRKVRFEYFEALFPHLAPMLEKAGFIRKDRQPIMTCRGLELKAAPVEGVRIQRLAAADPPATFETYLRVGDTAFEEKTEPSRYEAAATILRDGIASGRVVACLALLDDQVAGSGAVQSAEGVCELVGIATLPSFRRRGVGTAVSTWLAQAHFAAGGDLAWLTASGEPAQRVYLGIGFQPTGSYQLNYEEG